eukprot:TRINITY_DN21461_c0_g1_i5.p1 TRINITY_DN21461_c0_g1~~TRINITY_DN21461_c0_g1_i5.p1  ORF type:complete len:381 (-),score=22.49 TRINITY_DN21461_c0_g1_i5:535-1614(-)
MARERGTERERERERLANGFQMLVFVQAGTAIMLPIAYLLTGNFGFPQFMLTSTHGIIPNVDHEISEQVFLWAHLRRDDAVLSVGGNIGGTCLFIDRFVYHSARKSSLCVEPNPLTWPILLQNRHLSGGRFRTETRILTRPTRGNLSFTSRGIGSRIAGPGDHVDFEVPTVDLNLSEYTAVVADCEGCFCRLFKEFRELLATRLIIIEKDGDCDYNVDAFIAQHGFAKVGGSWFGFSPRHDVYSKGPWSPWSPVTDMYSQLMILTDTTRRRIASCLPADATVSMLHAQIVLALFAELFVYMAYAIAVLRTSINMPTYVLHPCKARKSVRYLIGFAIFAQVSLLFWGSFDRVIRFASHKT